jgi:hypothetical protein
VTAAAGGCLCGAVRYEAGRPAIGARTCWCRLCQYLGGGGATTNAGFYSEDFTISGDVTWHESVADSGNAMRRGFCPTCGTPMFSIAASRPHLIFARAGTLDDPNMIRPAATIWTSAAPDWACFDPAIPTIERQPPPIA